MQHSLFNSVTGRMGGIVALAACASFAWADPLPADGQPVPATPAAAVPAAVAVREQPVQADALTASASDAGANLGFGPAAALGQLEASRGGTDVHNDMKLDGVVTGNAAVNVVTGSNTIDTGAFANMSGIPVVIQNSGANVLIQSATIVNLQFQ